uniref:Abasic site processing protein HMCES n=2 Tax=Homalodisca liturata TaxID=320908 RepID=A0A1B6ICE6_9HEMI
MCGRISCHMCRPDYRKAASYFDESRGLYVQPDWIDVPNNGLSYSPSTNMAPTDVLPVLISKEHEQTGNELSQRVIKPMMWGMIPTWHKGDYKSHGLTTNNCRIESLMESRLYGKPLRNGQRCVIGCQGFYEWQTTKGKGQPKQPYFIKASQKCEAGPVEELDSWEKAMWDETAGWSGPQLLMMAGLFDVWTSPEGEQMFSFTIITMESNSSFSWLHHRIPAVLDSDEMVAKWLDHKQVSAVAAVRLLHPVTSLTWHPVSMLVNNSRNKDNNCNKPIDLQKPKPVNKIMDSWLKRGALPSANATSPKKAKEN